MSNPSNSVWSSLSIWARLSIVWSKQEPYRPYFLAIRFFSLFQTLLLITDNVQASSSQHRSLFYLLQNGLGFSLITPFWSYPWTTLGVMAGYFFMLCLITILTVIQLKKEKIRQERYAKLFSSLTTLHSEVLYYPLNQCFCEILKSLKDNQLDISKKAAQLSLISILLLLNLILTFFKILFCYSRVRSSKFISRKGSLHLLVIATLKLLLPLFHLLLPYKHQEGGTKYQIVSIIFSLVIMICTFLYTFFLLPEYNLVMMKMHIIFNSIAVGICVSQIAGTFIGSNEIILNMLFFIIPLWVKLNIRAFDSIIKRLKYFPKQISNNYHSIHLETIYSDIDPQFLFNIVAKKLSASVFEVMWLNYHVGQELDNQRADQNETIDTRKRVKICLKELLEKIFELNPKNVLVSLTYAKLIVNNFSFFSKAYSLCLQASKQRINIPDRISIYHIISKINVALKEVTSTNDSTSNTSFKIISKAFEHDNAFQDLKSQFSKYIEQSISFWKILKQEKPEIFNLFKQGKKLEKQGRIIEKKWKKYETLFSTEAQLIYFLYGVFKAQFLNKPWEGAQLIEKYNSYIKNRNPHSFNKMDFNNEYGTIMISGDRKNLGEIISCSDMISEIFGIEKKSLVNKNVTTIMPRFFQDKHYQFLVNQYEKGQNKSLWKKRLVYGKDSNHNIFPISILLGLYLDLEKGIIYTAIIKKIKDKNEFILFRDDGLIDEASVSIRQICGIEPYKKISINSICLDFDFETYKQQDDVLGENIKEGEKISLKVQNLVDLKKQCIQELGKSHENIYLEDLFRLKVKIYRHLYCNEILNVMVLEFQSHTQNRIRDIIALNELKQDKKKGLDDGSKGISRLTSNCNLLGKTHANDTAIRNTEYEVAKKFSRLNFPLSERAFIVSSSNNRFGSEKMTSEEELESPENQNYHFSNSSIQNGSIDNLRNVLSKTHPNRFKNIIINLFLVILTIISIMIGVQYVNFESSIQELKFTIAAIRTTYDRLTSLSLIWWYGVAYETRITGMVKAPASDLDRFKLRIRTKRNDLKVQNDDLMNMITAGQEYQQQRFFKKDIRVNFDVNSDAPYQRKMNTFEAVHYLIEKLTAFDATPHQVLAQTGYPDLEFVRYNIMNDVLISSEEIANTLQNVFGEEIESKKTLMDTIFVMNIVMSWFTTILVLVIFFVNYRVYTKLAKALTSINPQNTELIITKLNYFYNLLKKKERLLPKALYNFHGYYSLDSEDKFRNFKLTNSKYKMNGMIIANIKQIFLLLLLIFGIAVVSSIRYVSSNALLDQALVTNNQIIFVAKTRHMLILSYATLIEFIYSVNSTTVRNQRMDTELFHILDEIPLSNAVFDQFTDDSGQFIDQSVETIFRGKPCSLVINFPGSLNDVNCPTVTQNGTVSLLAIYSYSRDELYTHTRRMLANLTYPNAVELFNYIPGFTSPRINTLNGALMFLINFLSGKLDGQMLHLIEDAKSKLILQIILIVFLSLIIIIFLIKKVFDDSATRIVLKIVPFQEISKNKLMKQFIKEFYKEKIDSLE